jgi:hypothetical protein
MGIVIAETLAGIIDTRRALRPDVIFVLLIAIDQIFIAHGRIELCCG